MEQADIKSTRVRTGCLTCRERHLKCDGGTPACLLCLSWNRICRSNDTSNPQTRWLLHTLEGRTTSVRSVAFSPQGDRLASASEDIVQLWDTNSGQLLQTLDGHEGVVTSVAFSPQGDRLASASFDGTVRQWDANKGQLLQTLEGHTSSVTSVAFLQGDRLASISDSTVCLWDANTGWLLQTVRCHTDKRTSVVLSLQGDQLASASDRTVCLWDMATGRPLQTLEGHTDKVTSVAFSPQGGQLASASWDNTVRLWDTVTGMLMQRFEGHTDWVISIAFSPQGDLLASASWDWTVRLWDASTGRLIQTEDHTDRVTSVAFSPQGGQLASASWDNTVRLWDAITGRLMQTLKGHTGEVKIIAFSPQGDRLASVSQDNAIRLWNANMGRPLQTPAKKEAMRTHLPPLTQGPGLQFLVASHPDDFKSVKSMKNVRSQAMYNNRRELVSESSSDTEGMDLVGARRRKTRSTSPRSLSGVTRSDSRSAIRRMAQAYLRRNDRERACDEHKTITIYKYTIRQMALSYLRSTNIRQALDEYKNRTTPPDGVRYIGDQKSKKLQSEPLTRTLPSPFSTDTSTFNRKNEAPSSSPIHLDHRGRNTDTLLFQDTDSYFQVDRQEPGRNTDTLLFHDTDSYFQVDRQERRHEALKPDPDVSYPPFNESSPISQQSRSTPTISSGSQHPEQSTSDSPHNKLPSSTYPNTTLADFQRHVNSRLQNTPAEDSARLANRGLQRHISDYWDPRGGDRYFVPNNSTELDRHGDSLFRVGSEYLYGYSTPRRKMYATSEERKQRNRQAQAAFRERRTEYIKQLESTIKHHEDTLQNLQNSHRNAADECLMLRFKNTLLEKILLEKGIDIQAELRAKTDSPNLGPTRAPASATTSPNQPPLQQRAVMNRQQQWRSLQGPRGFASPQTKSLLDHFPITENATNLLHLEQKSPQAEGSGNGNNTGGDDPVTAATEAPLAPKSGLVQSASDEEAETEQENLPRSPDTLPTSNKDVSERTQQTLKDISRPAVPTKGTLQLLTFGTLNNDTNFPPPKIAFPHTDMKAFRQRLHIRRKLVKLEHQTDITSPVALSHEGSSEDTETQAGKRTVDTSGHMAGLNPARSPRNHLERDETSNSGSHRGTSVGTDIGDETDDTEWSVGGHSFQAPGLSKLMKKSAKAEFDTRLEVLEEESSDEGVSDDLEEEDARSCEREEGIRGSDPWSTASSVLVGEESFKPHLLSDHGNLDDVDLKDIRENLPEEWMWDVDYTTTHNTNGKDHVCWTCTPTEPDDPKNFPLTILDLPVVLPVQYQWPPMAGVNPPPDPRPSALIDCTVDLSLEVVRDIFLTFEKSIGFYLLINGLLQIIVKEDFDTEWASSHLPHKYGGLRVCYIHQTMEPTMFQVPTKTETMKSKASKASYASQTSSMSSIFRSSSSGTTSSLFQSLHLNDFIEARTKSSSKQKFAGRMGLKVEKCGDPYLIMSTHVITEAILAKSHMGGIFNRRDRVQKLDNDWNEHVEIWAGNEKIGTIDQTFDKEAEIYPNGFKHDVTLIKPTNPATIKDIVSPDPDLGWLSQSSWHSLRQRSASVKILGFTEAHRTSKTLKTSRPSEVLVVGEGIFVNQASSKPTRDQDVSTWKDLVSRAVLYRVYPDFDPPTGYSGIALYADGTREDGTEGPGVVGFQSFVQRSGVVQSFEMEGGALEKRLKLGRVAFYGAFMVPEELKKEYRVV